MAGTDVRRCGPVGRAQRAGAARAAGAFGFGDRRPLRRQGSGPRSAARQPVVHGASRARLMTPGGDLKSSIKVCMFDQYGTIVDMQTGLTEVARPYLEAKGWKGNPNSFVTWWRRTHFENSMIDALLGREHTPYREIGHRSVTDFPIGCVLAPEQRIDHGVLEMRAAPPGDEGVGISLPPFGFQIGSGDLGEPGLHVDDGSILIEHADLDRGFEIATGRHEAGSRGAVDDGLSSSGSRTRTLPA